MRAALVNGSGRRSIVAVSLLKDAGFGVDDQTRRTILTWFMPVAARLRCCYRRGDANLFHYRTSGFGFKRFNRFRLYALIKLRKTLVPNSLSMVANLALAKSARVCRASGLQSPVYPRNTARRCTIDEAIGALGAAALAGTPRAPAQRFGERQSAGRCAAPPARNNHLMATTARHSAKLERRLSRCGVVVETAST